MQCRMKERSKTKPQLSCLFFCFLKPHLILKINEHTGKRDTVPTTQGLGQSLPRTVHPCKRHPATLQPCDPPDFSSTQ